MEPNDHPTVEHHVTLAGNLIDELIRMVGQDRADRAVAFAHDIKLQIGHALVAAGTAIEGHDGVDQIANLKAAVANRDEEIVALKAQLREDTPAAVLVVNGADSPAAVTEGAGGADAGSQDQGGQDQNVDDAPHLADPVIEDATLSTKAADEAEF